MNELLHFIPIKKFIAKVGADIEKYFGNDPSCIVCLQPGGVFYGTALFEWLKSKRKNVLLTVMEDDGIDLEENKVKGRKVLIADGEIVTGKAYKRTMEVLRLRKEKLKIKDIKFVTYIDRIGLADFSVWAYSSEATWHQAELDAIDVKIISMLKEDGRMPFTEIGEKLKMSGVAVKNRVEWLLQKNIMKIQASLVADKFYKMSAVIQIDAEQRVVEKLIENLEKAPQVHHLVQRASNYNLVVGILVDALEDVENFVEKEIRPVLGVRNMDIRIGELPILPQTFIPNFPS